MGEIGDRGPSRRAIRFPLVAKVEIFCVFSQREWGPRLVSGDRCVVGRSLPVTLKAPPNSRDDLLPSMDD